MVILKDSCTEAPFMFKDDDECPVILHPFKEYFNHIITMGL